MSSVEELTFIQAQCLLSDYFNALMSVLFSGSCSFVRLLPVQLPKYNLVKVYTMSE